jgi:hypothetical protein
VEDRARSLGETVRAEIGALQSIVEVALDRFAELEAAAARNAVVFDQAVASAKDGAGTLSATLQNERIAFEDLTTELRQQSDVLGDNVGRQIRLMREASRLVRQEYVAADETFQSHLTNFAASAALMAERTEAMDSAATATQLASQRLDGTIVTALEALTQATTLTDTARQSAENATQAANATASAVRETTQRRLLLTLARDLKSASVRQRLRERAPAAVVLVEADGTAKVTVDSLESLSLCRLRSAGASARAAASWACFSPLIACMTAGRTTKSKKAMKARPSMALLSWLMMVSSLYQAMLMSGCTSGSNLAATTVTTSPRASL